MIISGKVSLDDFPVIIWEAENIGSLNNKVTIYKVSARGRYNNGGSWSVEFEMFHTAKRDVTTLVSKVMGEVYQRAGR